MLCVLHGRNQLPLQSDTPLSSYKGSKVGFDTFLAIALCVCISIQNACRTGCILSRVTFFMNTVMSSKVIQGQLWTKNCQIIPISATTSSDSIRCGRYSATRCMSWRVTYFIKSVISSEVIQGHLRTENCQIVSISATNASDCRIYMELGGCTTHME